MGPTIRVAEDSISGVKAMSRLQPPPCGPNSAFRDLPLFLERTFEALASPVAVLPPWRPDSPQGRRSATFLPARREPVPPVEQPRRGLEGLPEISRIVPLLGRRAALVGVQFLEPLAELLEQWQELCPEVSNSRPPAIRIRVRLMAKAVARRLSRRAWLRSKRS
jgi:hypothetical protein